MAEKKQRKKQVVIDELAGVMAEAYAARTLAREYEIRINSLQYELDNIIQQEVNK